ncbi:hypothetical protein ACE1AT_16890 [Pelatocladus sp. BLCC-F211]|uniref:hypothetical protein n=1 Tax=Pelatocladus sp. BLCC-F211 TaxID=3342752 RepID=UPI0035BB799B
MLPRGAAQRAITTARQIFQQMTTKSKLLANTRLLHTVRISSKGKDEERQVRQALGHTPL